MKRHGTQRGRGQGLDSRPSRLNPLIVMGIHLAGILAVAVAVAAVVLPGTHAGMLWTVGLANGEIGRSLLLKAGIHIGLSTLIWFAVAAAVEAMWKKRHRLQPQQRMMRRSRGSVYLEFIMVLPVFLLLTFGMMQLTVINIGGALVRVAAYEGARAVWLWQPELAVGEIDEDDLRDRARIAIALVMTPVAPGDFTMEVATDESTHEFKMMRKAMTARFHNSPENAIIEGAMGSLSFDESNVSLAQALDSASIPERAYRKFTFSYLATTIDDTVLDTAAAEESLITEPDEVGVHFVYYQHMAMPFVDALFGQPHPDDDPDDEFAGRSGNYFAWNAKFTFPPQRHRPNRVLP